MERRIVYHSDNLPGGLVLDDDELCRNEKRVKELTDWVKEALFGALDVGRGSVSTHAGIWIRH